MNEERDQILSSKISSKQLKHFFSEKYKLHIKELKAKSDLWCKIIFWRVEISQDA